jgi:hypothetical protein
VKLVIECQVIPFIDQLQIEVYLVLCIVEVVEIEAGYRLPPGGKREKREYRKNQRFQHFQKYVK